MKSFERAIVIVAVVLSLTALSIQLTRNRGVLLGSLVIDDFYTNASSSSVSVPTVATTTNPVLPLDTRRINARVCNIGSGVVWLHPKGQSTTTNVTIDTGVPIRPAGLTTSTDTCVDFPGLKGYLFGISSLPTTTVSVSSWPL